MKKLMTYFLSIYGSLKNMHYAVNGPNYYNMHVLADRLINDIDPLGVIDHLNEHMLGSYGDFVEFSEIMDSSQVKGKTPRDVMNCCKLLMQKAAREIESMDFEDRGLESYLTGVEDNLIASVGFIEKSICKGEE